MARRDSAGRPGQTPLQNAEIARRLDAFEKRLDETNRVCGPLPDQLKELIRTVLDLNAEIGVAPPRDLRGDRPTVRDRLHNLENTTSPIVVQAAMAEVLEDRIKRATEAWRTRLLLLTALAAAVGAMFGGVLAIARALQAIGWTGGG